MKKPIMIPFDLNGNMLEYVGKWMNPESIVWKENYTFAATLRFNRIDGSNPPRFYFYDKATELDYSMSLGEFDRVLKNCDIINHEIQAHWTFRKHGNTYSISLLPSLYTK